MKSGLDAMPHLGIKYYAPLNHSLWYYRRSYKRIAKPTAAVDKTMGKKLQQRKLETFNDKKIPIFMHKFGNQTAASTL